MKRLLVLRTNVYSKRWDDILQNLSDKYKVLIVADTKENKFSYRGIETITFSEDNVSDCSLFCADDMQWRFGDYVLYLADKAYPDYDHIWLFEPDVYINYPDVGSFFELFDAEESDFLCSYFSDANEDWMWTKYLPEISEKIGSRTFFPLIRISKSAVSFLYSQRKSYKTFANDEIFVATKLKNSKFKISTFKDSVPITYDRNHFSYRYPHYFKFIRKNGSATIYHPVFDDFSHYLRHLWVKKSWKTLIKKILGIKNVD